MVRAYRKQLKFLGPIVALLLFLPVFVHAAFAVVIGCPDLFGGLGAPFSNSELGRVQALIATRKSTVAYPEIPSLEELRLPIAAPAPFNTSKKLSAGLADPILEEARALKAFDDFKPLSDARPRVLGAEERKLIEVEAKQAANHFPAGSAAHRQAYLKAFIEKAYDFSSELQAVPGLDRVRWKVKSGSMDLDNAFLYTEKMWAALLRKTKASPGGSLLDLPYPMLVPGGRFQETYYWDTYFGIKGLLATDRIELAQMQTENLLSLVQRYGFIPNGNRDYYLTRSQPPFLSSAVREVFSTSLKNAKTRKEKNRLLQWLKERAFPLIKRDYNNFWMDPRSRFDIKTGLNHHWDDANLPRPERHGYDDETKLGKTFRDVRAGAESGLDFTDAHAGEASAIAPVLLNSMLYKVEADLAWMAKELGNSKDAAHFTAAAGRRATAMRKFLWNEKEGHFENFHLRNKERIPAITADTFVPLFVGMATKREAERIQKTVLPKLERKSGLKASELMESTHQWDGNNGWAPQQVMAVAGLRNYGYVNDAKRLAIKWTSAIANLHRENKTIYERINVSTGSRPAMNHSQYPTQEGFLWTNGSYSWMLLEILDMPKLPI